MPITSKLTWKQRIANDAESDVWWFRCQRNPHAVLAESYRHKVDAEAARTRHDSVYHLAGGATLRSAPLGVIVKDYIANVETRERIGKADAQTTAYYYKMYKWMLEYFGPKADASRFTQRQVNNYALWRMETGATRGALVVKELKALRTALYNAGIRNLAWSVDLRMIDPEEKEKRDLTPEQIVAFVQAVRKLQPLAYALVVTKLRTGLRDKELFVLRAGDVNLEEGVIVFSLRSKKRGQKGSKVHVAVLTSDVVTLLAPLVAGKAPDTLVFTHRGKQLKHATMRHWWGLASVTAGIVPPLVGIGQLRHEMMTAGIEALDGDVESIRDLIGHRSIVTTERYNLRRLRQNLEARRRSAEAISAAMPLGLGAPLKEGGVDDDGDERVEELAEQVVEQLA